MIEFYVLMICHFVRVSNPVNGTSELPTGTAHLWCSETGTPVCTGAYAFL